MFIAFNAILIALVLLIAYWWANQGLLSSVLHFACVVAAGSIAFAVWEPIAVLMLERDIMSNYAWGIALLGPFSLSLFLTRLGADKLVPENLNFPQWANFGFGGAFGLGSGVLTMGMCLIGGGFLQSSKDIMGFEGAVRSATTQGAPNYDNQRLWVPMHSITEDFYAWLSAGAFAPESGMSLRDAYPNVADVAFSLHRDSYRDGKARTSMPPAAVTLNRMLFSSSMPVGGSAPQPIWAVEMEVGMEGTDSGGALCISSSQVRLIEHVGPGENRAPRSAHPVGFTQPSEAAGRRDFGVFDDLTVFATNVPGQQSTRLFFLFPARDVGTLTNPPQFIQIKGLRVRLPAPENNTDLPGAELQQIVLRPDGASGPTQIVEGSLKTIRPKDLVSDYSINPGNGSVGELGNIEQVDNYLTYGKETFYKGGKPASKANRINGIYAPEGTTVLRLNISRGDSSIDVWNTRSEYRKQAGEQAPLMLVDSDGGTYLPTGYIWVTADNVEVRLEKASLATIADFPFQPSSGSNELYAIFRVTTGRKITSVRLGNIVLAQADYLVPEQTKR